MTVLQEGIFFIMMFGALLFLIWGIFTKGK